MADSDPENEVRDIKCPIDRPSEPGNCETIGHLIHPGAEASENDAAEHPGKQSEPHRDWAKRAQEIVVDLILLIRRHADSRGVSERSVTRYSCHFVHEVEEFGHEPSASKPQRGCANRKLVERHSLKSVQTIEERIHRLLLEQNSGNTRVHNFGRSA